MNERIKELAKQSLPAFYLTNCPSALEKFAELIVRECGVALSPMLRDMVSRGQAFDLIKKHFGVEE
jgi:hypothetical protein